MYNELILLDFIQRFRVGFLDNIMVVVSTIGNKGAIWIFLTIVLFVYKKTRWVSIMCALSLFFSFLGTNIILKLSVQRMRPFALSATTLLISAPKDYSFPSGHASAAFAFAFVLFFLRIKIKGVKVYPVVLILASLMAFSRLYLYVHFPSDIFVGILLGALYAQVSIMAVRNYIRRFYKSTYPFIKNKK